MTVRCHYHIVCAYFAMQFQQVIPEGVHDIHLAVS